MRPYARSPRTATELHRAWLELVDTEGPFLAIPPLKRVYPQGIPALDVVARCAVVDELPAFARAWDAWDRSRTDAALEAYRVARDAWVRTVLVGVLGWADDLVPGDHQVSVTSPDHRVTVRPTAALVAGDGSPALLVWVVDPVESLRDLAADSWATSAVDRLDAMLRHSGVPVGLVTDGRWWALVSAGRDTVTASGVVDALTWVEEDRTRDAFLELLSVPRTIGGAEADRLPRLFGESVAAAEDVTDALGTQVRRAVELLVSAFSEAERRTPQQVLPADGGEVYSGAVTVMMRVVFLLFAEERGLLPQTAMFADSYGFAGVLDELEARVRSDQEESLESTYATWHRLLATSNALFRGASFEDVRLPAYGGSLFDPAAHPFLSAADDQGRLRLLVDDRVLLHVLRSVQQASVRGESRRISFRDVDVEQIGYIYEGLLGYTCRRADEVIVGVLGAAGAEPEVPLSVLAGWQDDDDPAVAAALIAWAKKDQPASRPSSAAAYAKALRLGDALADADRALLAVTSDAGLREELRGWIGIVRRDLRNRPTVILPGGLLVVETPSRKNAGAHYTPKALAAEVVKHALDPLCYCPGPLDPPTPDGTWTLKPSYDILDLRIADIACGSGAFLVSAAVYLADRVVEAWTGEGTVTGTPAEMRTRALRLVVSQCLFGADINPMAIEMCKLSLWLVSLDPKLPFSFVDDKVFVGNSLLGLVDDQPLRGLLSPSPQGALVDVSGRHAYHDVDLDAVLGHARRIRERLASEVDECDPQRSTTAKRHLMAQYDDLLDRRLRPLADAWIATQLRFGGRPGKPLREAMESLGMVAAHFLATGDRTALDEIADAGLTPTVETDYVRWQPLHWCLAVPEVMAHGGFDAVIGNPPFLGGKKISPAMGEDLRAWFVHGLADGARGSADLVAYFFLRAFSLLNATGTLGLIATNTVAQGDTREVGLDRLVADGFTIHRAVQSRSWPSQSANLEYAAVWGSRRSLAETVSRVVDEAPVPLIGPNLAVGGDLGPPKRLKENEGIAFIGCYVLGMGFVVTERQARDWIDADPRNAEVLFPYVNGEDLTSRPDASASRWVIDFGQRSEAEAAGYKLPFAKLEKDVRGSRLTGTKLIRRAPWWLFFNWRPALRRAITDLDHVIALTLVSNTLQAQRVPTGRVYSHKVGVLASASFALLATLASSTHLAWTQERTSTMRTDLNYSPSDVFLTLPRPPETQELHEIGRRLDEERREIMLRRDLGLTKLYNLVHDPSVTSDADVDRLREIHYRIDVAVLAAYGWSDLPLDYGFHVHKRLRRWSFGPAARTEVLRRLTEENHRRAAFEHL